MHRFAGHSWFFAAALTCFVILAARAPDAITWPVLHGEDGSVLFTAFNNGRGLDALFDFYAGYISLLPRIVAYFVHYFPIRAQPHLFVIVPMAVSAAAFALFALPVFRKLVASDAQRAAICVGLAALPLGNLAKIGVSGYVQWSAGIGLCLLVLAEAPLSLATLSGAALFAIAAVLIWSNPISVVLAPLLLLQALRQRTTDRAAALFHLLLGCVCISYAVIGRDPAYPTKPFQLTAFVDAIRGVLERVAFEVAAGAITRMETNWVWADVAGIGLVAVLGAALWPRLAASADFRRFAAGCAYVIVVVTFFSAAFRSVALETVWGRRYTYTQAVLFALLLLIALTDVVRALAARNRFATATAAVAIAAWIGWQNFRNNVLYQLPAGEGARIAAFVDTIVLAEKANRAATLTYERGGWPIAIHIRPR